MAQMPKAAFYIPLLVLILFLLINFNLEIGIIYLGMALVGWGAFRLAVNKNVFAPFPMEKNPKERFLNLVWAMGAYVAFIFISSFVTGYVTQQSGWSYISSLVGDTFSATPILYGSTYLKLMVWGILIPIVETLFFFRQLLQWSLKSANVNTTTAFSSGSLMLAGFIGALFAVFHIVAKGITSNVSLLVTFIFGMVSVLLVLHFKQMVQAVFLHIITNTIAVMQQLRIGFFSTAAPGVNAEGFLVLGGVIIVSWLLMFSEIPFVQYFRG